LIRHAVNEYVRTGRLAGWTPEVHLNDEGKAQAKAIGQRLASAKIEAVYSSPLERTIETAQEILNYHCHLNLQYDEDLGEVRYGEWQGEKINKLSQKKEWFTVQHFPTRMQFPKGEAMRTAQLRAVNAVERLTTKHPKGVIALVSHSDIIKMILAHYLGMHLDMFQRINIAPASLSILALGSSRPTIDRINDTSHLKPQES
jgi:probable phosphomutase (TIGR03848 family)